MRFTMRAVVLVVALVTACFISVPDPRLLEQGDAAAARPAGCATYCDTILVNCTGSNAQYGGATDAETRERCMATCAQLVGTAGAPSSLECRMLHASNAVGADAGMHCPAAGPAGDQIGGGGVCGSPCENFCAIEIGACGVGTATAQYRTVADCTSACASFDRKPPYTVDAAAAAGNSLACRLYYATSAAMGSGFTTDYCPATASTPTGPCVAR